ncbi:MAG: hypothetical protein Q9208_003470 [Pyrenodesmia sp. 3 TL-2023]
MNPAMRSQYHNIHHQNASVPSARRGGIGPITATASQAHREAQREQERQTKQNDEAKAKEMAQRRANKPTDKNMPDGIDEFVIGDGVEQYKRMRDIERRLDAMMMRKRLDLQDTRQNTSMRYKTMRIWISNTVDFQNWQRGDEDELYDFSGSSEGVYRMKIEGRLLDVDDDTLPEDDDSDAEEEEKSGATMDQDQEPAQKAVFTVGPQPRTRLSHFFKTITVELDRNKNLQADYTTQIEWNRPPSGANFQPRDDDFDSLEFERKGDSDMNCTIRLFRDEEVFLLSDPMAELLDSKEESRRGVLIGVYEYIKAMDLQQDDEKRAVQCDDRLRRVFRHDVLYMPNLPKLIEHHIFPLPPIVLPYTIRCNPDFHTSTTEPPTPTIYNITFAVTPNPSKPLLPSPSQLEQIRNYDSHLALVIQAIQHSKSKHAFMTEFEKDPVGFLKRWMASQRRDLEVIVGDGVGMGRGEWGVGDGYGVGPEWRRGGEKGVWGRDEVRESVKLMRERP